MSENNGNRGMTPGSKSDMAIAYVFRVFTVTIQGAGVLMLWAVIQLLITVRDDTRDLKRDMPTMQQEIRDIRKTQNEMKQESANYATTRQLTEAEMRVSEKFSKELEKQKLKGRLAPDGYR